MAKKLDWTAAKERLEKKIKEYTAAIKDHKPNAGANPFDDLLVVRELNASYLAGVRTKALYDKIMKLK